MTPEETRKLKEAVRKQLEDTPGEYQRAVFLAAADSLWTTLKKNPGPNTASGVFQLDGEMGELGIMVTSDPDLVSAFRKSAAKHLASGRPLEVHGFDPQPPPENN